MLRLAILLLGLGLLSACNMVMTDKPLFTPADAAGAPVLRPGVWAFYREPGCQVDESQPFAKWPDCSGGGLVGADEISGHKSGAPADSLEHTPVVLAAGDPRILQLQVDFDVSAGATASASGDASASASASVTVTKPKTQPFGYAAVSPTKFDSAGRITAFRFWPVQCGPPPPKDANGADTALATLHPLPGLEMKPGDALCSTTSIPALRNAAKASEAWTENHQEARWLRGGDR